MRYGKLNADPTPPRPQGSPIEMIVEMHDWLVTYSHERGPIDDFGPHGKDYDHYFETADELIRTMKPTLGNYDALISSAASRIYNKGYENEITGLFFSALINHSDEVVSIADPINAIGYRLAKEKTLILDGFSMAADVGSLAEGNIINFSSGVNHMSDTAQSGVHISFPAVGHLGDHAHGGTYLTAEANSMCNYAQDGIRIASGYLFNDGAAVEDMAQNATGGRSLAFGTVLFISDPQQFYRWGRRDVWGAVGGIDIWSNERPSTPLQTTGLKLRNTLMYMTYEVYKEKPISTDRVERAATYDWNAFQNKIAELVSELDKLSEHAYLSNGS